MIVGITGNFGAGKTTVANMFRDLGAKLIDADKIAHRLMRNQEEAYKQIIVSFGKEVLSGGRHCIDRKKLAAVVFKDAKALKRLNRIMHPGILSIIKNKIKEASDNKFLVIEAALLIESGLLSWVDKLIVVKSDPKIQMKRLGKNGLTLKEIKQRLRVQMPQGEKIRHADFVIDNSGVREKTKKQVIEIWNKIRRQ
ncbi:MAG: dephospho-CoA kinase [Candidatus Omnitrophota bacterium]